MANSTVYHLGGADSESFTTIRRTGWLPLTDMSRNTTIRRLNARYRSPESVTAKIYANGDSSTHIWTKTLPSNITTAGGELNPVVEKYKSLSVGRRANSIMVEISTSASTNTSTIEIGKLEVEVDG